MRSERGLKAALHVPRHPWMALGEIKPRRGSKQADEQVLMGPATTLAVGNAFDGMIVEIVLVALPNQRLS